MKKIGLVIAVEIRAFNDRYGEPDEIIRLRKQEVRKYVSDTYELYVMQSGAGEIAAASTTQFLISEFNVLSEESEKLVEKKDAEELLDKLSVVIERIELLKQKITTK